MTILEAIIDVAVNFDATAKSMKNLANIMKGVADNSNLSSGYRRVFFQDLNGKG